MTLRLARAALLALLLTVLVLLGVTALGGDATLSLGGLTLLDVGVTEALLLALVTGVGLVVTLYSERNLQGQPRLTRYGLLVLTVVGGLSVAIAASPLVLLAAGWTLASYGLASLVAHSGSGQARRAARLVHARLAVGDALLWAAVLVTGLGLGAWDRSALGDAVTGAAPALVTLAALLAVGAGVVRSALVPAHRWLPETAEAPSPVSALLHAGFVNGVGVLALLLWPLLQAATPARVLLVAVGVSSVLLGAAAVRTRADLKGRLAASTSSQMGYLALQVALGIPAAVVAHLVGHGVWKARKFLGAGGAVQRARDSEATAGPRPTWAWVAGATLLAVAVTAIAAVVPLAGWPVLTAPADLLPLVMTVAVTTLAAVTVRRSPALPGAARRLALGVIALGAVAYVAGLRGLTALLEPTLGVPAEWGTADGWAMLLTVAGLVVVGVAWLLVDAAAGRGQLPRFTRWVARQSLQPRAVRELVRPRPVVAPVVTSPDESVRETSMHLEVAAASTATLYPLTTFVASNPLSGIEGIGFSAALNVATEVGDATAGPSAALLAAAVDRGEVTADDVDAVLDEEWSATAASGRWSGGALRELVAALLLDDAPDPARVAAAERALLDAGVAATRRVRTPLEVIGDAELDERVRSVGHHVCARSLAGAAWPGAMDPWRELAAHARSLDSLLHVKGAAEQLLLLPSDPAAATAALLSGLGVDAADRPRLLARLLARDPGWPGHLNWRSRHAQLGRAAGLPDSDPEDLLPALAATRLALEAIAAGAHAVDRLGHPLGAADLVTAGHLPMARLLASRPLRVLDLTELPATELRALAAVLGPLVDGGLVTLRTEILDRAYRRVLVPALGEAAREARVATVGALTHDVADAQLVFCIDVRSERLRRHLEARGAWETLGAAGFFGLPVRHTDVNGVTSERAPALLRPGAAVVERPAAPTGARGTVTALNGSITEIEANPCLVLGWAEAAGWALLPAVGLATQLPAATAAMAAKVRARLSTPRTGRLDVVRDVGSTALADAAADFLTSTGVVEPAPLVVLVGHGATVTNNPHVAAYDCGACGGAAGDVSARVMAATLNDNRVREALRERGLVLPPSTRFVAALHDTTTDEVELLDRELLPATHRELLQRLEGDLVIAGEDVLAERLPLLPDLAETNPSRRVAVRRATDWAQPRPEWGLAGASAIVVGPRTLTRQLDLGGRVFLQSYRPDLDLDGSVLAALLEAPVVVAHWISSQYRASTLDPRRFGAGDKTTHNVVGDGQQVAAVITGARGDLRLGLPWQALAAQAPHPDADGSGEPWVTHLQHLPRRLLVVVSADVSLAEAALSRSPQAAALVAGEWITLCSVDPSDGCVRRREPDGSWTQECGPQTLAALLPQVA